LKIVLRLEHAGFCNKYVHTFHVWQLRQLADERIRRKDRLVFVGVVVIETGNPDVCSESGYFLRDCLLEPDDDAHGK